MNSLPYTFKQIHDMITRVIEESNQMDKGKQKEAIKMPITREGMIILFKSMNLKLKPTKAIDAVIYCRGPKMEQAPEEDF